MKADLVYLQETAKELQQKVLSLFVSFNKFLNRCICLEPTLQ
jgi:hypothetical protein